MFDVDQLEHFDARLKNGLYPVVISEAHFRPSNENPMTHLVEVHFVVSGAQNPDYEGFTIRDYMCVQHENEQVVKRGKSDLRSLMLAVGVKKISDVAEFIGHRLLIETKLNKDDFPNVIARRPVPGGVQNGAPQGQVQQQAPQQQGQVQQQAPQQQQFQQRQQYDSQPPQNQYDHAPQNGGPF